MEKREISLSYIFFAHHPYSEINRTINFKLRNTRVALCARCTGKYLGLFLSIVGFTLLGPLNVPLLLILLLPLPATIDWVTQTIKLRESINHLRIATGLLYGFWVGIFFQAILVFNQILLVVMALQAAIYIAAVYVIFALNPGALSTYAKPYEEFIAEYQKQKTM